ncbi:hypothetical protein JZX76_10405 [Haloarcula hispanica]|uniref:Uncharacterized protein n=1 Tax=Haloarcula hispanica TaxID=51589 RepID=A0A482T1P8_HALHI|nr:hypothetical protein [Haloarcula hispanica]MCJ0619906.1 hypothetical protein [Haloarcula hispanica]RYJ10348.1 hypothetical protein ELS20_10335 [Haloarcula hispanica]
MAQSTADRIERKQGIGGLAKQANPAFAVGAVAVPLIAFAGAVASGNIRALTYVHVMAGVLWTGIDLFMGLVLGPVLGGQKAEARADFFASFTPKMTFLMPSLATVTISGGILLALPLGKFPNADPWLALLTAATLIPVVLLIGSQFDALTDPKTLGVLGVAVVGSGAYLATTLPAFAMTSWWIVATLGIVTLLSVQGFGVILPGEVRIYRQVVSENPDVDLVSEIGMRNARLGGLQGLLQLAIVFVMVGLRWWTP